MSENGVILIDIEIEEGRGTQESWNKRDVSRTSKVLTPSVPGE